MKTILVVDDDSKIRDVVGSYLQKESYRTLEASTGREALVLLDSGRSPAVDTASGEMILSPSDTVKLTIRTSVVGSAFCK